MIGSITQAVGYEIFKYFKENGKPEEIEDVTQNAEITVSYIIEKDSKRYKIESIGEGAGTEFAKTYRLYENKEAVKETVIIESTAKKLQGTVSKWYSVLRDIAVVASLSILVYIGIRIMLSSTSKDKAKYKQLLMDWVVAFCLLFMMHYIMSLSNYIVEKVIALVDSITVVNDNVVEKNGVQLFEITDEEHVEKAKEVLVTNYEGDGESPYSGLFSEGKLYWPTENFTEQARMMMQFIDAEQDEGYKTTNITYASIGWKLVYCVLVIYTIIFVITYLKRLIYMTFLTIIAPLVALTYPIDKVHDGKAQAFNTWIKEYIFNLLIQPLHLMLYMILIGMTMEFASTNIIYTVAALGFLTQAEKLLRSFFGFEKAKTPGLLGGPGGAALMMSGLNKLLSKSSNKDEKEGKGDSGTSGDDNKISYKNDFDSMAAFEGEEQDENDNQDNVNMNDDEASQEEGNDNDVNQEDTEVDTTENVNTNDEQVNATEGNDNSTSQKRSIRRGLARAGNRIMLKASKEHTLRKALGVGTGLAGAALAGTAAGIIGITSGDPSKAAQYMGAAALGGYKGGKGIPNKIAGAAEEGKAYKDEFQKGYYTDEEYKQRQIEKNKKIARQNKELMEQLERRLGDRQRAEDAMAEGGIIDYCVENGITDEKDMLAVAQMQDRGMSRDQSIATALTYNEFGKNTTKMTAKEREELEKTIKMRVEKNRRLTTEAQRNATKDRLLSSLDEYSKIRNK